jgi:precorrin-6B methylase 1
VAVVAGVARHLAMLAPAAKINKKDYSDKFSVKKRKPRNKRMHILHRFCTFNKTF